MHNMHDWSRCKKRETNNQIWRSDMHDPNRLASMHRAVSPSYRTLHTRWTMSSAPFGLLIPINFRPCQIHLS
jgi:hypothetical protein